MKAANSQSPKGPKRKVRISQRAWILLIVVVSVIALICVWLFRPQPSMSEKLSLTTLDKLTLSDLADPPRASFENKTQVQDYTLYGTSLVFYDQDYEPLESDGYFGRNVMLRNIKTGEEISETFTGGADGGINLQTIPEGVYEIYLADGYTYKRAFMSDFYRSSPFITYRDDKQVKSVELAASNVFLEKFGIETDENYLFLTVTESLPHADVYDVVIDPSGYLIASNGQEMPWYTGDDFDEAQKSWEFAQKIAAYLESAGLKVMISRNETQASSYAGAYSRTEAAYDSQAKLFLSLTMVDDPASRPFFISSPFTNGKLGNELSSTLREDGIELYTPVSVSQLNDGNSYDQLAVDEEGSLLPYSLQPALRETGGRVTSAGGYTGWGANAIYGQAAGMESVIFCYASSENADSRSYFLEHEDAMARDLAQGILNSTGIQTPLDAHALQASQIEEPDVPSLVSQSSQDDSILAE